MKSVIPHYYFFERNEDGCEISGSESRSYASHGQTQCLSLGVPFRPIAL
jgi:hypothetical protein